jgi:hypothetical protein
MARDGRIARRMGWLRSWAQSGERDSPWHRAEDRFPDPPVPGRPTPRYPLWSTTPGRPFERGSNGSRDRDLRPLAKRPKLR